MPIPPAEIFSKIVGTETDKTLILTTRTQMIYPFSAPDWTDLRVGFFLSVTKLETGAPADDDTITGLAESIAVPPDGLGPQDRYWIGLKDRGTALPKSAGTRFIGFTNSNLQNAPIETSGASRLTASDIGVGGGTFFWRPNNSGGIQHSGGIWSEWHPRGHSTDGVQQHFVQDADDVPDGAGGYATLLAFRVRRNTPVSNSFTVTVPKVDHPPPGGIIRSCDIMFTNTPTLDIMRAVLVSFPTAGVQTWGPSTLAAAPDAIYLYWPFALSRLRVHAVGILRKA